MRGSRRTAFECPAHQHAKQPVYISSAYDPRADRWVFTDVEDRHSSASVYNPVAARVEVERGGHNMGVSGVFNPAMGVVEWKKLDDYGVAGYFDPSRGAVVWNLEYHSGVACLWRGDDGHYDSSNGFTGTPAK